MTTKNPKGPANKRVSAPQRDPPSSEEIADSLVDAFIKIATDQVADEEWREGYQAGLADATLENQKDWVEKLGDFLLPFSIGFLAVSLVFVLAHVLHWWS